MFADASNFVQSVDNTFIFIVAVCVFFLVLITTLMIVFVVKYSRKKNKKAVNIHGSVPLEIAWTVIPTLLVLVMFYFGWEGYVKMQDAPPNSMIIKVTAQMWSWKFEYPNGVKSDTLYVPINQPVKVLLHSMDVDHSFYVPAFRIKKDVIPNYNNTAWFRPEQLGKFDIMCAVYCGLRHSYMYSAVVVMKPNDFKKWLDKQEEGKSDVDTTSSKM